MAKWKNNSANSGGDPTPILKQIRRITVVKDQRISWKEGHIDFLCALLEEMLEFNSLVPVREKSTLIFRAITSSANELTPQKKKKKISLFENEYLKLPLQNFYLLTSFSVPGEFRSIEIPRITGRNYSISFPGGITEN